MKSSNQSFVAFFSYVRRNDEHDKGRLTTFRKLLEAELWSQTGKDLQVFQDKEDIEWGDNWKERITKVLDSCAFLIVMVTPGYLESQSCRFEFEHFLKRESFGNKRLILPILYIDTPELKNSKDPVATEISKRQWIDWRDLRLVSLDSVKVNRKIESLVKRIRDMLFIKETSFIEAAEKSSFPHSVTTENESRKALQLPQQTNVDLASQLSMLATKQPKTLLSHRQEMSQTAVPIRKDEEISKITVFLEPSSNVDEDRRRIKTIYGTLISFHGRDRFLFQVSKDGKPELIEFPNDTTRVCPELLSRLGRLMGKENWRVEEVTIR